MLVVGEMNPSPGDTNVPSNGGRLLELFLSVYASRCKDFAMEMNPRAVRAAMDMQDAMEQAQKNFSSTQKTLAVPAYTLTAVPLGVSGSNALVPTLAHMPLVRIDLGECYLGDAGTRILADSLSTSPQCSGVIREICLSGVGISDASSLAVVLTAAQRLQVLDVSRNRIGTQPEGLAVLCAAMHHHRSLREVNLSDDMISGGCVVSMRAIAEWIVCAGHRDTLQRIDLRFNALGFTREAAGVASSAAKVTFSIHGLHPFLDALLFNNTLEFLELYGNALAADVLDIIEARLAVNRRTKEMLYKAHSSRYNE